MTITNLCGVYYAMMRNQKDGGGFIGRGRTHAEALTNCLKAAGIFARRVPVSCAC